ncbi:MAG: NAD(P) transhydrogenase subunit alpha [Verrucomicrobiales bacterium]|jgi:NAD(P) transhydrogenase subunit alpha|nr:NAD(P) transhydrogenase subunit alpha [Verrucomicrobiales bacterium]
MRKIMTMLLLPLTVTPVMAADVSVSGAHVAEPDYVGLLFVFLLSTFIGLMVITQVSRLLHTPLMSLTNAISAIAVVGAILVGGRSYADNGELTWINMLGLVAIVASVTNIVSGFLITDRMLKMFKQRGGK